MPLIVIAAAAFVSALDATFMNVAMSQVVIDLNTDVATIQKMVSQGISVSFTRSCPGRGRFKT